MSEKDCIACHLPITPYKQDVQTREDICECCAVVAAADWAGYETGGRQDGTRGLESNNL